MTKEAVLLVAGFGYGAERSRDDEGDGTAEDCLGSGVFWIEVGFGAFDRGTAVLDGPATAGD